MEDYKTQKIALEHPCYICGRVLSRAQRAISHLEKIHGYRINSRSVGVNRLKDPNYTYVNDPKTRSEFEAYHCACPSCWYHCPCDEDALTALADHIKEAHHPLNVNPGKNENGAINSPQVNYVIRNKILPEGGNFNRHDKDELETGLPEGSSNAKDSQEVLEIEEEEETKTRKKASKTKNTKKNTRQQRMQDLYQKLVDVVETAKTLLNNN